MNCSSPILLQPKDMTDFMRSQVALIRRIAGDNEADALCYSLGYLRQTHVVDVEWERYVKMLFDEIVPRVMHKHGYVKSSKGKWILRTNRFIFWANIVMCAVFVCLSKYTYDTGGSVQIMFWMFGLCFFTLFINRKHSIEAVLTVVRLCRKT